MASWWFRSCCTHLFSEGEEEKETTAKLFHIRYVSMHTWIIDFLMERNTETSRSKCVWAVAHWKKWEHIGSYLYLCRCKCVSVYKQSAFRRVWLQLQTFLYLVCASHSISFVCSNNFLFSVFFSFLFLIRFFFFFYFCLLFVLFLHHYFPSLNLTKSVCSLLLFTWPVVVYVCILYVSQFWAYEHFFVTVCVYVYRWWLWFTVRKSHSMTLLL